MNDRLARVGGAALLAGSAFSIVLAIILGIGDANVDYTNPMNIAARWVSLPASLLLVYGLPALTDRLSGRARVLALLGSAGVALSFLIYGFAFGIIDGIVLPYLASLHFDTSHPPAQMFIVIMAGGLSELIGGILLGLAALRSGAVPRPAGALILAAGLLMATTIAPVPEWIDTVASISLLLGLAISAFSLLGLRTEQPAMTPVGAAT